MSKETVISTKLSFSGLRNTRDLGGMPAADGRMIKKGLLFRSGQLFPADDGDKKILFGLGLRKIYDLRTSEERVEKPDPEIPGAENVHISILKEIKTGISREEKSGADVMSRIMEAAAADPEFGKKYMCGAYAEFIKEPHSVEGYQRFINDIFTTEEGGILWHCSAGKDRAGFATVILQHILGVDRETIFADYLATNLYAEDEIKAIVRQVEKNVPAPYVQNAVKAARDFFSADEAYLETAIRAAEALYGSLDGFIRNGLKVDEEKISELRDRFLTVS